MPYRGNMFFRFTSQPVVKIVTLPQSITPLMRITENICLLECFRHHC